MAILLFALSPSVAAQEAVVRGQVKDRQGKGLRDVEVTLSHVDDPSVQLTTTTDKKGRFKVELPAAGPYAVTAEKSGFGPYRSDLAVEAGMEYEADIPLLEEVLWKQQRAVEAFNEGVRALQSGDTRLAAERFEEAASLNPDLIEAYHALAAAYHGEERFEDALEPIDRYLEARPEDVQALPLAFEIYFQGGKRDKALAVLERITDPRVRAELAPLLYNEAVHKSRAEEIEEALEGFRLAAELDPELAPAYQGLAAIEFNRGNYEAALPHLEKLLSLMPGSEEGLRMRFHSHRVLGDERAQEALKAYLDVAPPKTAQELAASASEDFEAGRVEEALSTLEPLVAARPDLAIAHYHLGRALASRGEDAAAKQHLQRFLELAPEHAESSVAQAMVEDL